MTGNTGTLCVRRATYWCPELGADDPAKKGVCSNFLCDAKAGDSVRVSVCVCGWLGVDGYSCATTTTDFHAHDALMATLMSPPTPPPPPTPHLRSSGYHDRSFRQGHAPP